MSKVEATIDVVVTLLGWALLATLIGGGFMTFCSAQGCRPPEPCSAEELPALEARCFAEILVACKDAPDPSPEGDPEAALVAACPQVQPVLDACERRRQAWVRCD